MMSRKDYRTIADVLKNHRPVLSDCPFNPYAAVANDIVNLLAENLADVFEADNPRFNRQKFINACIRLEDEIC